MFQIESASLSDTGKKRQNNEDFIAYFEPEDPGEISASGCLYIVADGVGGAIKGEKASRYAAQKVLFEYYRHPELPIQERLQAGMRQASNEIYLYAQDHQESRMATTMVAVSIRDDKLTVANVGDSRAYLIRNDEIQQITRDHSLVGEMVRDGLMSEDESHRSHVKNVLTRSLGGELDPHIDVFADISLQSGDRILLCSDGLSRYAQRNDIYALAHQGTAEEVVKSLVGFANHQGGADNISVILITIGSIINGQQIASLWQIKQSPAMAEWENIPTLVDDVTMHQKGRFYRNKRYITWGILVLVILWGFAAIVFLLIKIGKNGTVAASLLLTQTGVSPVITISITATSTSSTVTNSITPMVLAHIEPTETITPNQSLDIPIITESVIISATATPNSQVCIYRASNLESPSITAIYDAIFHINSANIPNLYYYLCSTDVSYEGCQPRLQVPNDDNRRWIQSNWYFEIPGVGKEECLANKGIIIQPP